jgi:hypothetical protein
MTGKAALRIWGRAKLPVCLQREHARLSGRQETFVKLEGGLEVLRELKVLLTEAVTTEEEGALGVINRDLANLEREFFTIAVKPEAQAAPEFTSAEEVSQCR